MSDRTSSLLTFYHTTIGQPLIYGLVGLHLVAIAYYAAVKRLDLVRPMVTGTAEVAPSTEPTRDGWKLWLLALVLLAAGVALAWWVAAQANVAETYY